MCRLVPPHDRPIVFEKPLAPGIADGMPLVRPSGMAIVQKTFPAALRLSAIAVSVALCAACSGGDSAAAASDDAGIHLDAQPGIDAQGDGAAPNVWLAGATGFELSASWDYRLPEGCTYQDVVYRYDVASRLLTRSGCTVAHSVDATVTLTTSSAGELIARLSALVAKAGSID
jgi:hypothetical protein